MGPEDSLEKDRRVLKLFTDLRGGNRAELEYSIIAILAEIDPLGAERLHNMLEVTEENLSDLSGTFDQSFREIVDDIPMAGLVFTEPERASIGEVIGNFKIEKFVAQGGMSSVYRARRVDDLALEVAIKTLWTWQPKLLALFQSECKILSTLTHPGIARLIDAGIKANGQPWMAMEYINGLSLTQHVAKHCLNLKQRLHLFLQICDALTHAHHQMIIHRDLKPSNIMVTDRGRVKLLDFGIAALLNPDTGEQDTVTMLSDRLLTPQYASPEQLNGLRLSSSSDVYSLGVIFYELLVGHRPYESAGKSQQEMVELVNTASIAKPSSVLNTTPYSPISSKHLRGDLDTIALKALEKQISYRYHSVEAMSEDIRRYLNGDPITARPATPGYRLRKLVQRHPWPMAMGSLFALFLIFFASYANHQSHLNAMERDEALKERRTAETVTNFMLGMFEQIDPDRARDHDVSAIEVMEQGRLQLESLNNEPEISMRLKQTLASVYSSLGRYSIALELYRQAGAETVKNGRNPFTTDLALARTYLDAGQVKAAGNLLEELEPFLKDQESSEVGAYWHIRANYLVARGWYNQADEAFKLALQNPNLDLARRMDLKADRAQLFFKWGFYKKALANRMEVLEYQQNFYGKFHSKYANTLHDIGQVLAKQAKYKKAQETFVRVGEIYSKIYAQDHPSHFKLKTSIINFMMQKGAYQEAEQLTREHLAKTQAVNGREHHATAAALKLLGTLLAQQAKFEEAERFLRESLVTYQNTLGLDHSDTASLYNTLGNLMLNKGNRETAQVYYDKSLNVLIKAFGEDHPHTAATLFNRGRILLKQNDLEGAASSYEKALSIFRNALGEDHPHVASVLIGRGELSLQTLDLKAAVAHFEQALTIQNDALGEGHPTTAYPLSLLGDAKFAIGDLKEAKKHFQQALDIQKNAYGENHPSLGFTLHSLAKVTQVEGDSERAISYYEQALNIKKRTLGKDHKTLVNTLMALGDLEHANGALREARNYLELALAIQRKSYGESHQNTAEILSRLGKILQAQGDVRGAVVHQRQALLIAEEMFGVNHTITQTYTARLEETLQQRDR